MALGAFALAGCETTTTLAQAQALCKKQGGLLIVLYTQKVTNAGAGPPIASPGNCVPPSQFDVTAPAPGILPAPAPAPMP